MWKYVGQRLKDTTEVTCPLLKNLRSTFSTYNDNTKQDTSPKDEYKNANNGRVCHIWKYFDTNDKSNKAVSKASAEVEIPYILQKSYEKQKQKQHEAFHGSMDISQWLQWSAAILGTFHFGQMICLYSRRRQNMKRWHNIEQVLSDRTLRQTLEKFYQSQHQRSWVPTNDAHHWYDADQMRGLRALRGLRQLLPLVPVTNDHLIPKPIDTNTPFASVAAAATQTTRTRTDISLAADNLIATLGSIEFRLGMQNLRANQPEIAVAHLKLATTHHHPEATFNLGLCYETGHGIQKNMKSAMECYRIAAGLGNKKAMYNLGVFYVHGRGGLKKNIEAARACFQAAEKKGSRRAKAALRVPEKPVTPNDDEIVWKSNDLIANKLSAVNQHHAACIV